MAKPTGTQWAWGEKLGWQRLRGNRAVGFVCRAERHTPRYTGLGAVPG